MKFFAWKALARGVLLESVRRKDLWVVAILGFLTIAAAGMLGFFGFSGLESFAKDLAVTVLGLFSSVVAVLVSCRMLPEEIRQRTLYPLLARPISRFDLLFGKFAGAVLVSWLGFLLLAAASALALSMFKVAFAPIMLQYLLVKMMGLTVLCALSVAASAYMTPAAAATLSLIFAFGSSVLVRAVVMAGQQGGTEVKYLMNVINAAIPQMSLFDLGSRVANTGWTPVAGWVVLALAGYAIAYCTAMLILSWLRFRRQAV